MHIKNTTSLCEQCGQRIVGMLYDECGQAFLTKQCSQHGETTEMIEPDAAFVRQMQHNSTDTHFTPSCNQTLFLDVTQHCNMRCQVCYYPVVANGIDWPISRLIALAKRTRFDCFTLTGGEPTTRKDLPQLVQDFRSHGYHIYILTNGLALADEAYCDTLIASFDSGPSDTLPLHISIHPKSSSSALHYKQKRFALEHLKRRKRRVSSLMFTLQAIEEIHEVMSIAHIYHGLYDMIRIRAASVLRETRTVKRPIYISEMLSVLTAMIKPGWDNNIYHVNATVGDVHCRFIKWPVCSAVDLELLSGCGPYALTRKGDILNVIHAGFIEELRTRKGSEYVHAL